MLLPVEAFERLMSDAPTALSALQVGSGEAKGWEPEAEGQGGVLQGWRQGARGKVQGNKVQV